MTEFYDTTEHFRTHVTQLINPPSVGFERGTYMAIANLLKDYPDKVDSEKLFQIYVGVILTLKDPNSSKPIPIFVNEDGTDGEPCLTDLQNVINRQLESEKKNWHEAERIYAANNVFPMLAVANVVGQCLSAEDQLILSDRILRTEHSEGNIMYGAFKVENIDSSKTEGLNSIGKRMIHDLSELINKFSSVKFSEVKTLDSKIISRRESLISEIFSSFSTFTAKTKEMEDSTISEVDLAAEAIKSLHSSEAGLDISEEEIENVISLLTEQN